MDSSVPEKVILVHGMGRTAASMLLMARRLKDAGFPTVLFNYFVSMEPLDEIAERLVWTVERKVRRPYALVGHSLGGVLARMTAGKLMDAGLKKLVMLGPPNTSPVLAQAFRDMPVFRLLAGDAGQRLSDPDFHASLPIPQIPTLVFAGTSGPRAIWLPHKGEPNDGVVTVEETRLAGAQHRMVPGIHTTLMNDRKVTEEIIHFLREPA